MWPVAVRLPWRWARREPSENPAKRGGSPIDQAIAQFVKDHYVEILSVAPCVLLLAGVVFAVGIDPYLRKRQKRTMLVICALVSTLIAQNYLEYLLVVGEPAIGLRIAASVYGYCARPIVLLMFLYIVAPERRFRLEWALVGVNAVIHLTAFFSDVCFTIDADNHYQGGLAPLSSSCLITSLVLLAELVYLTVREYRPSAQREAWLPLFVTTVILLALFADDHVGTVAQPVSFLTIAIVIGCTLYYFWLHLRFVREYEQALEAEQRMRVMMTQIQPHFLYNTLATIRRLCLKSPEEAARTVEQFSRYLRQNLDTLDQPALIPFEKELDHTRIYAEIEMRMFPYIRVEYDVVDDDFALPALTVQPLVENAIRHGVRARDDGRVRIGVEKVAGGHVVVISDNGLGFDPDAVGDVQGTHIGIRNVRERVERLCGGTLAVESAPGEGATATIFIPDAANGTATNAVERHAGAREGRADESRMR